MLILPGQFQLLLMMYQINFGSKHLLQQTITLFLAKTFQWGLVNAGLLEILQAHLQQHLGIIRQEELLQLS